MITQSVWQVLRHGGRSRDTWRVAARGTEETARRKYAKIAEDLRQGTVRLISPEGQQIAATGGPRLRTNEVVTMRRRTLLPLDRLVIGASPDNKLRKDLIPAASPREAVPLSIKERARLQELSTRRTLERLTPAELYELQTLQRRRGA